MPKVSVIVPVYNTEKYLRKCLDSIVGQTLENIEILCIDDCSTDSSLNILQEYAQKDSRVKVFRNSKNKGLSATRNVGIDNACGEYIQFVDSDDWIKPDTLELFYCIAVKNRVDWVKSLDSLKRKNLFTTSFVNQVLSGKDMLIQLMSQCYCGCSPCVFFLSRDFMKRCGLKFASDVQYMEDILFMCQVIDSAQRCMCINEYKYVYVVHENSLSTGTMSDDKLHSCLYVMKEILKWCLLDCGSTAYQYAKYIYMMKCYTTFKLEMDKRLEEPDIGQWEPELQTIYYNFFSGRGWLENLVDRRKLDLSREAILNADHIYIFGAGRAAQRLIQILYRSGVEIDGVIVSNTLKNRKNVYGYPVSSVDEIATKGGQPLILSAVIGAYDDICILLREYGFCNVIDVCP